MKEKLIITATIFPYIGCAAIIALLLSAMLVSQGVATIIALPLGVVMTAFCVGMGVLMDQGGE